MTRKERIMSGITTPFLAHKGQGSVNLDALREATEHWHQSNNPFTLLCRRLTTSLSLESLVAIFVEEMSKLVPFDQMTYRHQIGNQEMVYATGLGGQHRCDYRLTLEGIKYGELTFRRKHRFAEEELSAIEQMLSVAILPIRNACQYAAVQQAALTDPLTQIPNKRALNEALEKECHLGDRHNHDSTLILCDLDRFKLINDNHGHVIGDHILRAAAAELARATRNSDTVFRFGGEEFAVILPHADQSDGRNVAERIREFVAKLAINCGDKDVTTTISVGVAMRQKGETPDQWVARADEALYRAKNQGRNCTRIADSIPNQKAQRPAT
jgi:diguanylate cyclase (GGDEF)-like protein